MKYSSALLAVLGLAPFFVGQAQEALLSSEAIVVNPAPSYEVEVFVNKDPSGSNRPNYGIGETVQVGVRASEDAYVYLFDVRSDGSINQILPNNYDDYGQDNFVRAGETKYFPPQDASYNFTVAAPQGLDKVIGVASHTRLDTSTLATFQQDPNFASSQLGEQGFAEGLSVIVRPLPRADWVTDTALFYVVGGGQEATPTPQPQAQYGTLSVTSEPSGAQVYVDGEFAGRTPLRYSALAGEHQVEVSSDGYGTFQTSLNVVAGETRGVQTTLQAAQPSRASAQAGFDSTPSGAEVYVDGQLVGTTPLTNVSLSAGTHQAQFILAGVGEDTVRFTVGAGGYQNVSGVLQASPVAQPETERGTLELAGNVGGANVFIDGNRAGTIPNGSGRLSFDDLSAGTHEITVTAPGFSTFVGEFEILAGQATSLTVSQRSR